jgi:hypothetical protein
MEEKEALAFWERFSAWMEEHRGDLAGFAAQEGYASVHPGVLGDRPVLRASKSAEQRPYATVKAEPDAPKPRSAGGDQSPKPAGGSPARHGAGRKPDRPGSNPRDFTRKPRK